MRALLWIALTAINGGLLGWDLAAGSQHAWFSGALGVLCLILSTFAVYDFWVAWKDERYERKHIAEVEK